ncbi:MAG: family transcriptional regulator, cyclic receptor protein [Pseudomonadota bacterium]|nr:family transcriptional regulator, cyclic receptor protein [Pseudomonadota bacterium]
MSHDPARPHAPPEDLIDALALSPDMAALARQSGLRRFRKGVLLIQEGDVSDTVYLLLSGQVKVYAAAANGREITFGLHGPGALVGEMSLDGGPRSASAVTTEPTLAGVVTRAMLLEHMRLHPEFALEMLMTVIARARSATRDARDLALVDSYGRLSRLFETMARPADNGQCCIEGRLTHSEIASRIGCSREMVSRLLKDLERGGYIAQGPQQLTLLRPLPARW